RNTAFDALLRQQFAKRAKYFRLIRRGSRRGGHAGTALNAAQPWRALRPRGPHGLGRSLEIRHNTLLHQEGVGGLIKLLQSAQGEFLEQLEQHQLGANLDRQLLAGRTKSLAQDTRTQWITR